VKSPAPTTAAHHAWYALGGSHDPLAYAELQCRVGARAQGALARSTGAPWQPALDVALRASRTVVAACQSASGSVPQVA